MIRQYVQQIALMVSLLCCLLSMGAMAQTEMPVVNMGVSQDGLEGTTVTIDIFLDQVATTTATLTFELDADDASRAEDFSFINNPVLISGSDRGQLMVFLVDDSDDGVVEGIERIQLNLVTAINASIGADDMVRVFIRENNVSPLVDVDIVQNGIISRTVNTTDGNVTLRATVDDLNLSDTHTYLWSSSIVQSVELVAIDPSDSSAGTTLVITTELPQFVDINGSNTDTQFVFDINDATPIAAVEDRIYFIDLTVTDNGGANTTERITFFLSSDNLTDRTDNDGDGFVASLDSDDTSNNPIGSLGIQAETGVALTTGILARGAANGFPSDIVLSATDASNVGIPEDANFTSLSPMFDIQASGHFQTDFYRLVIPVSSGIPEGSVLRLFNGASARWNSFLDDNNSTRGDITSAEMSNNQCPPPGSDTYVDSEASTFTTDTSLVQLTTDHECIQVTIFEGQANDSDSTANGVLGLIANLAIIRVAGVSLTVTATSIDEGETVQVTVTVVDANSMPVAGADVDLGVLGNALGLMSIDGADTTTFTTNNEGQLTAIYGTNFAGASQILASVSGVTDSILVQVNQVLEEGSGSGRTDRFILLLLMILTVNWLYRHRILL